MVTLSTPSLSSLSSVLAIAAPRGWSSAPPRDAEREPPSAPTLEQLRQKAREQGPLSADELAEHRSQQELIQQCLRRAASALLIEWELGRLCLIARESGYWLRDPQHQDKDFLQYVRHLFGLAFGHPVSRQTVERRLAMAAVFSREQIEEFARCGVGPTIVSDIALSEAELRQELLKLALSGASSDAILAARRRLRQERGGPSRGSRGNRGKENKPRESAPGPDAAAEKTTEAAQAREQELATREAQMQRREQELSAREGQVQEREQELSAREGQVQEREQELSAREGQVQEREQELSAREGQVQEREQELSAREGQVQRREQELEAGAARLGRDQMDLIRRDALLCRREAALLLPSNPTDVETTLACIERTAGQLHRLSVKLERQGAAELDPLGPRGEPIFETWKALLSASARCFTILDLLAEDYRDQYPAEAAPVAAEFAAWLAHRMKPRQPGKPGTGRKQAHPGGPPPAPR